MIRVNTLYDLKKAPPKELVYVETVDRLYRNLEGEWIEKVYYTTREISEITGRSQKTIRSVMSKLNMRSKMMRSRTMDLDQLRVISQVLKMREKKWSYDRIRKELRV